MHEYNAPQVALITGGGSGIGFEITRQLGELLFSATALDVGSCAETATVSIRASVIPLAKAPAVAGLDRAG